MCVRKEALASLTATGIMGEASLEGVPGTAGFSLVLGAVYPTTAAWST